MKTARQERREHAIVIGGSMAGLLAARVLAKHFERVTLLERDVLGTAVENRRGVPQGRHTHGLLAGGREALETLFPGFSGDLVKRGAVPGDIVGDTRWFLEGGCHRRFESGLDGLLMSRPFVESYVRERVRQLARVDLRDNCQVNGLLSSEDGGRVTGVRIGTDMLDADLVVDTTGRGGSTAKWLEELGYARPVEERVEIALAYTTRCFRRRPQDLGGDAAVIIPPTPMGKVGGVMIAQEDSRWTVTLTSHFVAAAPSELDGFIEFTRQLPADYIYEVVKTAEPLGEPAVARFPASVRRRYERLAHFPEGYVVMGDAICSFNPIYGQGMTVAALEARELDGVLARGRSQLARRFFQAAAKVVDIPWSIAAGNDLRMPEATGQRSVAVRIINAYMAQLHKAAHGDRQATLAFHQVGSLLKPPTAVFHPSIVRRVLWSAVRRSLGKRTAGVTADQLPRNDGSHWRAVSER
jgi:2-polyprenyl-6-methoxyphenol hydroxylase-like FAD-dependent oxidoreductase